MQSDEYLCAGQSDNNRDNPISCFLRVCNSQSRPTTTFIWLRHAALVLNFYNKVVHCCQVNFARALMAEFIAIPILITVKFSFGGVSMCR